MGCILSSQLRSYQRQVDELEAMDDAITEHAEALVSPSGDMYPFEPHNFWDALFNESCLDLFKDKTRLDDPTELGKEIIRCVEIYWNDRASEAAEEYVKSGRNDE